MSFRQRDVDALLVATGRHCCICFTLHSVQVHHILPLHEGGTDDIDNAIPLCPNCHDHVHRGDTPGRVSRQYGVDELKGHRERTIGQVNEALRIARDPRPPREGAAEILVRMATPGMSITQSVSEALALAARLNDDELLTFCGAELLGFEAEAGWVERPELEYRTITVIVSLTAKIDPQAWSNAATLFHHVRTDPEIRSHFRKTTLFMNEPVAEVEELSEIYAKELYCFMNLTLGAIMPDAVNPDAPLQGYIEPTEFLRIQRNINAKLRSHLVRRCRS